VERGGKRTKMGEGWGTEKKGGEEGGEEGGGGKKGMGIYEQKKGVRRGGEGEGKERVRGGEGGERRSDALHLPVKLVIISGSRSAYGASTTFMCFSSPRRRAQP